MHRTTELPRQGWSPYLEALSRRALGHPVRVRVENAALGDQELTQALPLLDIELESKGSERGAIELSLGDEQRRFTHRIPDPRRLYVLVDEEGDLECVSLEDGEGTQTLLVFEGEPGVPAWSGQGLLDAELPAMGG